MKYLINFGVIMVCLASNFVCSQTKNKQYEQFQPGYIAMETLVKSKAYTYTGEVVFNATKREMLEQSSNQLTVNQNKISARLSRLNKRSNSCILDGEISNYNVNYNTVLQEISITFNVDNTKVLLYIKPNGNLFLTVNDGVSKITQRGRLTSL